MIENASDPEALPSVQATGWKPGRKSGWKTLHEGNYVAYQTSSSRELSLAYVLRNEVDHHRIEAQTCRSVWEGLSLTHQREYLDDNADGGDVTLEPSERPAKVVIDYENLVRVVELNQKNQLIHGDQSLLIKGGWSFRTTKQERVSAIAQAIALEEEALSYVA